MSLCNVRLFVELKILFDTDFLVLTDGRLVRVHELRLGHLAGRHLEGVVIGGAGGQALAVGLRVVFDIKGRLVNYVRGLLDALQLLRAADGRLRRVARHVEGDAPAVLQWNELGCGLRKTAMHGEVLVGITSSV